MTNYFMWFFALIGFVVVAFVAIVFLVATYRVIKKGRVQQKRGFGHETLGCGEHVFAVLKNKNGQKEMKQ